MSETLVIDVAQTLTRQIDELVAPPTVFDLVVLRAKELQQAVAALTEEAYDDS